MTMLKQVWAALLLLAVSARPYIKIAEPLQDAVVYGEDDGTGQNIRGVRLVLHYYDLPDDGYDRLRVVIPVRAGRFFSFFLPSKRVLHSLCLKSRKILMQICVYV